MWLGALTLDALFGGRKAFGALPSLDGLLEVCLKFLRKRLERENRSPRAHVWRGTFVLAVLGPVTVSVGLLLNSAVFWHTATATLAAVLLAQMLATKLTWQLAESLAKGGNSADRRQSIEIVFSAYSMSFISSMLLFLIGGFALLLPYRLLLAADNASADSVKASSFLKPFVAVRRLLASPGELLAIAFTLFAALLVPWSYVAQGIKTLAQTRHKIRNGTLAIVSGAFNMSLQTADVASQQSWIGPENGTAKIDDETCRHALIVALVAFAVSIAFLLVLLLAAIK